jgi:nitroreductase
LLTSATGTGIPGWRRRGNGTLALADDRAEREGAAMDAREAMRTARAIRRFTTAPVDDDTLRRCLEAATWAPSGGNQQQWRFLVLRSPESRAAMAEGAAAALANIRTVYKMSPPEPDDDSPRARSTRAVFELHERAAEVPAGVLFLTRPQPMTPPLLQGASIYPAMQNFLIAARVEGLGAVVTGWAVNGEPALRRSAAIPDEWGLAALVVVGWPRGHHGPVRRRPVEDVALVDRWDQPFR